MGIVNCLRENDMLLLSVDKIDNPKSLLNCEGKSLKEIQKIFDPNKGRVLCIVNKKWKKSEPRIPLRASCEIGYKIHSMCKMMTDKKQDFY